MSQTPLILCYHAVSDEWTRSLALPQARLLRQVRLLRALGFQPCSARQALSERGRLLHLTFDDAYASILPALAALRELGVGHSVYVCSSLADGGGAPLAIPELAAEPRENLRTLTWDQIREAAELGTEVYSHTVTHPHLPLLSDSELAGELRVSRERLEDELSRPCPYLAYPFGEHDARVRHAAQHAGYEAAFALGRSGRGDTPFAVPRVGIYQRDGVLRALAKTTTPVRRRFYSG